MAEDDEQGAHERVRVRVRVHVRVHTVNFCMYNVHTGLSQLAMPSNTGACMMM